MRRTVSMVAVSFLLFLGSCSYTLTKDIWSPPFQLTREASKEAPVLTPLAVPLDVVMLAFVPLWETVFGVFMTDEFREAASAYNRNQSYRGEDYAGIGRDSRPSTAPPNEPEPDPKPISRPTTYPESLYWVAYGSSVIDDQTKVITQIWCMPASFRGSSHISGLNVLIPPSEVEQAARTQFTRRGRVVHDLVSFLNGDRGAVVREIEGAYRNAFEAERAARTTNPTFSYPQAKFLIINGDGGIYRSQDLPARPGTPSGSAK